MTNPPKSCLIIGNGAIGTAITCRLQMLGFRTSFIGRRGPIYVKSRFEGWGKTTYLEVEPLSQTDVSKVDIAFVTLKAYDLHGALMRYISYIPLGVPIVILSNGAVEGVLAQVSTQHSDYIWRIGVCTFGVSKISSDIYQLKSSSGSASWGAAPGQKRSECEMTPIERSIIQKEPQDFFQWDDNIIDKVRLKWLSNVVINSLCAANELPKNGLLLQDMNTLTATFNEAYRLGQELWGGWNHTSDNIFKELVGLISSTSENENSMARDVRLGQRTENEYLAKLCENKRGYQILPKLSKSIESKKKVLRRP